MTSDLNISHGQIYYFVIFLLPGFTLVIRLIDFDLESHRSTLIFFDKKGMTSDLNMPHGKMSVDGKCLMMSDAKMFDFYCLGSI